MKRSRQALETRFATGGNRSQEAGVMWHHTKRAMVLALVFGLTGAWPVQAQLGFPIVVHDHAVTLRNAITAVIQDLLFNTQRDQRRQMRRMARRLAEFTNLAKYAIAETPRWRIHDFETEAVLFAHTFHAALNYGDGRGSAYMDVVDPVLLNEAENQQPYARAPAEFLARLATISAADAVTIAATNDAGLLRRNGRLEQAAIAVLQAHVTNPSLIQSTTAVLEKITGAGLLRERQGQARLAFVTGIVEQLLVDTKRARDTEATAINMQLTTWRDGDAVNHAFASGAGEALRTWRQP